jgi:hypothetical protein
VSSQSKGSCHHCLQNGIDVFFLWRQWWRRQQWSSPVSVFIHSSAIVLIAPNATDNASQPLPVTMLTLYQARASYLK